MLAAYSAVVHSPYRHAAITSVFAAGILIAAAVPDAAPALPGRFTALLVLIPVVLAGHATLRWRRQAATPQARLLQQQAEQEAATRRALDLERARIASELHDVVTHNVSVMIVQAGAARQVLADAPGRGQGGAARGRGSSGRAAMAELRHLLGLLSPPASRRRTAADRAAPGPTGRCGRSRAWASSSALIDRVTAAGLPVELHVGDVPEACRRAWTWPHSASSRKR